MSLESTHAAAATAATAARTEVKKEWYKTPAFHFAVAAGIIGVALIINFAFEFNFFWKLLLGGGLVWGGGRLHKLAMSSAKVWGNILRGLGWFIIVVALRDSGVLAVTERGVLLVDETLTGLATGLDISGKLPSWTPKSNNLTVDFRGVEFGKTESVEMGIGDTIIVLYSARRFDGGAQAFQEWGCPKSLGIPLEFKRNTRDSFVITEESKVKLLQQHSFKVNIQVTSTQSPWHGRGIGSDNPCDDFKMN